MKKKSKIFTALLIIIVIPIVVNLYKDGGTSVYWGLGYKVIDYNQLNGRIDVVFKSLIISKGK